MTFREIKPGSEEYAEAIQLREAILRRPLGLTLGDDELADEANWIHLGGFDGPRLVAVLLLRPLSQTKVKMRQVAVAAELQGQGIGSALVSFAETLAKNAGYTTLIAHARESAAEFYQKIGYTLSDDLFNEHTIPHRLVSKSL
jgi:GNAT superfamily N-acetyltransferase